MKRKKMLLITGILIILLSVIGISYASWTIFSKQPTFNILGTKCFEVTLENASEGITLPNAYPTSDEEGKLQEGYTFTVKNICDTSVYYQVNLEELALDVKQLSSEYIRFSLNDLEIQTISNLEEVPKTLEEAEKAYRLETGLLGPVGSDTDEETYVLKLWMDENTPVVNEVMNASFKAKISVIANYYEQDDLTIQIAGLSLEESTSNATATNFDFTSTTAKTTIKLPNADSTVTLNTKILNLTNEEYGILAISNLPEHITYEISNYAIGEKLCDMNNQCSNGIEKDITITLKYATDGYEETNTTFELDMLFEFGKIHPPVLINFDANGGSVETSSTEVFYGKEYGTLPVATREGYTFSGWAIEQAGKEIITEQTIVNIVETHTLYAQWNAKSYTIRYHANGGTGVMPDQVIKYDAIVALSKNLFEKEDYSFFGWALSEDGEKAYNDMDSVVNLKLDGVVDFYAIWKQDSYTVAFDYNGGTGTSDSMQVLYGEPYGALPDYPYLQDKLFIGWYTEQSGGSLVLSDTIVDKKEDHTLYAQWEDSPSNTVIQNLVIKNVPDQNGDGVMDAIYLSFNCSDSYEKYNIPLKNLIVGQKYKLSFTASNNAAFGQNEAGYKNAIYGSIITKEATLSSGSIKEEALADGGLIAQWSDRTKGDTWLNGPFDMEMIFIAEESTMYWTWDFGLIMDYILYDFNFTNITLEPVIPEINFSDKNLVLRSGSAAQVLNDVSDSYSTNFTFDGDSYAETIYSPITGLIAGSTYEITLEHTYDGVLIDDSSKTSTLRYDYGFGIMNTAPETYSSYLTTLGTWASNTYVMTSVTGNTDTITLTFTATSDTAYWVWNMANCSDSVNNTIDIKITSFSATHSSGEKITYYTG